MYRISYSPTGVSAVPGVKTLGLGDVLVGRDSHLGESPGMPGTPFGEGRRVDWRE